ncbi:MAG TPA: type VI secretion system tube protein Hcp [Polyangia bacterium]|nr:type VI secretion system tube protein Hcp [Polyangia bacterium]
MRGLTLGVVALAFSSLAVSAGCSGPDGSSGDMLGRAQIALTNVPADGTCVQVVAAGYRTVTRDFDAPAGATSVFEMPGLPLGQVTFTASAFGGACPPATGVVANWISDAAFTATVAVDPPVLVTLNLVRNGNADVSIGFDDGADGGTTTVGAGGASPDAGAGGGSPAGSGAILMQASGVTGGSKVQGAAGAFDLESFTLGATTPSTIATGSGAGAGKTTWAATAKLRFQQGVPDLYAAATKGMALKTVNVSMFSKGAAPFVIWQATMSNVVISSIQDDALGTIPDLTVTFVFTQLKIEYDGARNADGTAGAATVDTFDLATNMGPGGTAIPLQFVVGAAGAKGFETVSAFRAPSEMTAGNVGSAAGGAGGGKATFTDASVTIPIDASALAILVDEVAGRSLPTATVQIETLSDAGLPTVFGTYGFKNVQLHGITLSGTTATVSFGAASFSWMQGTDTATF